MYKPAYDLSVGSRDHRTIVRKKGSTNTVLMRYIEEESRSVEEITREEKARPVRREGTFKDIQRTHASAVIRQYNDNTCTVSSRKI